MPHHQTHHYLATTLAILAIMNMAEGKEIVDWDLSNVITEEAPRESNETYHSFVCTSAADDFKSCDNGDPNGAVIWTEEKDNVQAEGMKVVSDAVDGYCIMTNGTNPLDAPNPKTCKDDFQTSKRFKVVMYHEQPTDLVFNVAEGSEEESEPNYRIFLKLENWVDNERSLDGFTLELGKGIGSAFKRFADSGISFTDDDGNLYADSDNEGDVGENKALDAVLAFGLFGNKTEHTRHNVYGYFDPTARARYILSGNPTVIEANGLTDNGASIQLSAAPKSTTKKSKSDKSAKSEKRKGRYLKPKSSKSDKSDGARPPAETPLGFVKYIDTEDDPVLIADLYNGVWRTFRRCYDDFKPSDSECIPISEEEDFFGIEPVELSENTIEAWTTANEYHILPIEDLRNVNVNTHVKVSDAFDENQFTLRISPKGGNNLSNANDNFPTESNLQLSDLSDLSHETEISSNQVSVRVTNNGPDPVTTGKVLFQVVNTDGSVGWRKTVLFGPLDVEEDMLIEAETESGDPILNAESEKLVVTAEAFAATGDQPTLETYKEEIITRYLRRRAVVATE